MVRINVIPTKTVLHHAHLSLDTQCRHCSCQVETLGHVLNGYQRGKRLIINRHDKILLLIICKMKPGKKYLLIIDQLFPNNVLIGDRRPDIQLMHERSKTIIVADALVCYESSLEHMDAVSNHKINKYNDEFALLEQAGYKVLPALLSMVPLALITLKIPKRTPSFYCLLRRSGKHCLKYTTATTSRYLH